MSEKYLRNTYVYGTAFWKFYNAQTNQVQRKIDWVIGLIRTLKVVPEKFFKHLEGTNGLFEIRIKAGSNIFRIFCFFDESNLVILLNAFQKKSNKIPKNEIKRAEYLRQEYYEEKNKRK